MSTLFDHLGVDVSKANLDCRLGEIYRQFTNTPKNLSTIFSGMALPEILPVEGGGATGQYP